MDQPEVSYGHGYILSDNQVAYLEGRLLTIIEALGLSANQEKATKDLVRNEVRQMYNVGHYISSEQHTKIVLENSGTTRSAGMARPV